MDEREMVLDVLNNVKAGIANYSKIITECSDQQLRKTFQQMRDGDETFQYELFKIADEKGYYTPSQKANAHECANVKECLCGCFPK